MSIFVFSVAFSLHAEDKDETFYGNFMFGYRMVDTSGRGADFKYKEDINLDDGVRLFNFSLHFVPNEKLKKFFNRIDINVYNFGGDPFENSGLSIQKYGTYKFQYDRKKAVYFTTTCMTQEGIFTIFILSTLTGLWTAASSIST